jgi:hypothetical protein
MSNVTPSDMQLIDKADSIYIPKSLLSRYHNDVQARESLWAGLELLYAETRKLETTLVPEPLHGSYSAAWGNIPGVPLGVCRQVSCFFDWYSVSASNFVLLTGWLVEKAGDLENFTRNEYRWKVIPDVMAHRNKIGAHPSRLLPQSDGQATQEASNFRQLTLVNDRLYANYMVFARRTGGERTDSRALKRWSLTETHERLRQRFVVSESGTAKDAVDEQAPTGSHEVNGGDS